MIDLDFAATQAARLSALVNFPELREGRAELARSLAKISLSREHCEAIVDAALENCRFSPTPAELLQFARNLAPDFRRPGPDDCPRCSEGWRTELRLVTWHGRRATSERITKQQALNLRDKLDTARQMVYEAAVECDCEAGRHQKQLGATRAASMAAKREQPARRAKIGRIGKADVGDLLQGLPEAM